MGNGLEPLAPRAGIRMYVEGRRDELSAETLQSQEYRLEAFVQWCDEAGIESLSDLSGRDLYEYRIWRREGNGEGREEIKPVTLRGQLATLRAFLRFAAEIDAVPEDLREKVPLPTVSGGENVSETTLDPERANEILDYLEVYEYASFRHTLFLLMFHTGARAGAIRGLDLRDLDLDKNQPKIRFVHRPELGQPLKNGEDGERWNSISPRVARVLQDYIDGPRNDHVDEHGHEPLFTTSVGRPVVSTIRDRIYSITRPCWMGNPCPHDRDPDECDATYYKSASTCPSSRSPHDVRSGRVTAYRRADVPRRIVSDRLDASGDILDRHYDRRSEREKSEQRRNYLPDE